MNLFPSNEQQFIIAVLTMQIGCGFSRKTRSRPGIRPGLRRIVLGSLLGLLAVLTAACQGSEPVADLASNSAKKVIVRDGGICQVALEELDWNPADLDRLQVRHRDEQVPAWIAGGGREAKIHFYCQLSQSPYTPESVYQISPGPGESLRIAEHEGVVQAGMPSLNQVTSTLHIEENALYSPVVQQGEHWFWEKLTAPERLNLPFDLVDVAEGEGELRVMLWGSTEAAAQPDHHLILHLNGQVVGQDSWDGQTRHVVAASIPPGVLREGTNTLEIELPGDTGVLVDIAYLDWAEISYQRLPRLVGGSLAFSTADGLVTLSNYRGAVHVFDITDPTSVSLTTIVEGDPFQTASGHRYLAVDSSAFAAPDRIETMTVEPDLRNPQNGAAYLVIGPEDLLGAVAPLVELRRSQGLTVRVAPVSAIYDQFNGGMAEPSAIQSFLAYAAAQWDTPPRYVLLVGDASYDFRGYTHPESANRLPVMMVSTVYGGETGSDVVLADINQDPWPDLAIGRIPARTPEQVTIYVEKVHTYEGLPAEKGWQERVLAVADGQEARFQRDAAAFLEIFSSGFQTTLVTPQPGDTSASKEIAAEIESGYWLTAYFGHGSLTMWGKDRLFTIEDSQSLSNVEHLPIMMHLTCLTGLFTHPTQESLMENLLWNPEGGAIAILAPTSLTLPGAQVDLTAAFAEALLVGQESRLGDAALHAWRQVPVDVVDSADVMKTFLLFGDPALKLQSQGP